MCIVTKLDLKNLKKQLLKNQKAEQQAKQEAQRQQANDNRDTNFFREAMEGVSPLSHDRAYHEGEKPTAKRIRHQQEEDIDVVDPLSDQLDVNDCQAEEVISYCATGIQKSVFRKLRSGQYRISDELDLHGTTLKQAKKILMYYLQEAVQFESCCVRVVHGKGHRSGNNKPVLKSHVNHWLVEHERVLAFHSTKVRDGGAGAVYVLLKNNETVKK